MQLSEIIEQAKRGDATAFDRLVADHRDLALGYARKLVRDRESAEDAVQDAFIIVHQKLDRLMNSEAFVGWLRGIVRNRCLREFDRSDSESWHDLDEIPNRESREQWIDYGSLRAAVAALPPGQRTLLSLLYEVGLTQSEIGERLRISKATVNMRLHAARQRLKGRLIVMNEIKSTTTGIGRVESADGPLVTLRFSPDETPIHYSRLLAGSEQLCVIRSSVNGVVHAAATRLGAIWIPGQQVRDVGEPFTDALSDAIAAEIVGKPKVSGPALSTGIKTVDVFAPLAQSGAVGLFAEWGLGVLVLVPELVRRINKPINRQAIYVFGPAMFDERQWREADAEITVGSGNIEVCYIPVADPISPGFIDCISSLDTKLILSRSLAEQGIWPCIDPIRSTSRVQSVDRRKVAKGASDLIRQYYELQFSIGVEASRKLSQEEWTAVQRGRQAVRFLSQPFHVAEPYTGHPGVDADPAIATQTFADILTGHYDGKPRDAFLMTGATPKL